MDEIIIEASPEAEALFRDFIAEHPEETELETSRGQDGATLLTLIVQNAPILTASIALLVGTLKGRAIKVKVSKGGIEINVGSSSKTG